MKPSNRCNGRRRAFGLLALALAAAASISACSDEEVTFTGIWKSNCGDYWGVQIKPAEGDLYALTFCGLSGCLGPGEWTPDTPIKGDPTYQVVSADKIRIKRSKGDYFTYIKCSADPFWQGRPNNH